MNKEIKTILFTSLIVAMILPFSAMNFADAAPNENVSDKAKEKSLVKEKIKDKMKKLEKDTKVKNNNKKHTSAEDGIPYNIVFEENGILVVGISAEKAVESNKLYSKADVQNDLGTDLDIDVRYAVLDRQANLRGGDGAVNVNYPTTSLSTITVVKNNKIILTGHSYAYNEVIAAGQFGSTPCKEVKVTKDNNSSGDYADSAYAIDQNNNPNCDNDFINDSIRYNGNTYSVTYGTASDIVLYKAVLMAGIKTPTSSGHILDTDVTTFDDGGILNDQVVGNYPSDGGDSGAPVFEITGSSSAKLLGQHVGKVCWVDLNSGTSFTYWCSGSQGLTIFSPWDQVASHLGI